MLNIDNIATYWIPGTMQKKEMHNIVNCNAFPMAEYSWPTVARKRINVTELESS